MRGPHPAARHSRARRAGRLLAGLILALVLAGAAGATALYWDLGHRLATSQALASQAPRSGDGATNILLIGLDSRRDQDGNDLPKAVLDQLHAGSSSAVGGYNTNTLILVHLPADAGKATAVSIPRDDLVDLPGLGPHKIKEAYGLAKYRTEDQLRAQGVREHSSLEQQGREAGRRATLEAVRTLLGVPIDHFAEVNLAGFFDLATALGGVEVCLTHPVHDGYSGADFPAGRQSLDGAQALAFVRQRHGLPNGDLDRTHRQQAFLASVIHKLRDVGQVGHWPALYAAAGRDIVFDAGWDVLSVLTQAGRLTGGQVDFHTLPITGYATYQGADVNLIDVAAIQAMVHALFDPTPTAAARSASAPVGLDALLTGPLDDPASPAASTAVVQVRNGSGRPHAAARLSRILASYGFHPGEVTNTTRRRYTMISYGSTTRAQAEQIAGLLGTGDLVADATLAPGQVRIDVGTTFREPPANGRPATSGTGQPGASAAAAIPRSGPHGQVLTTGGIPCVD